MNKKLLLFSAFMAGASWTVQAQDLVLSEGQYYTDATQTTPYTGRYTDFYDDGMLMMELYLNLRDLLAEWQDRRGAFLLSWELSRRMAYI